MQSKLGHCILCGWTSCCHVPHKSWKTGCEVGILLQAPDTPLILHSGGYRSFPQSSSGILSLVLAPLAIFIITAQLKILGSFQFQEIFSPGHLLSKHRNGGKEKELFAAGNSAEVEEKTRRAPLRLQKFNWLQWCLRLVISHGHAAESATSVWGVQNKIWHKCFSLVDDLPFGNNSWNHPGVTWKQEQMLADHQLNIFSLTGPIKFPEVPGSNIQIVLALTKCASFRKERRWHLGSSSRVSKETEMGSG